MCKKPEKFKVGNNFPDNLMPAVFNGKYLKNPDMPEIFFRIPAGTDICDLQVAV